MGAGALAFAPVFGLKPVRAQETSVPRPGFELLPPISAQERMQRVARAQELMRQAGIGALLLEPGSSMLYFTGISWWRSERLTAAIIPAEGEIGVVTPFFEEPPSAKAWPLATMCAPGTKRESVAGQRHL
jgi:Xaa-Pro dipeptidase